MPEHLGQSVATDASAEVEELAARAMTRLNKLRVPNSVSQQRYLSEARDYLAQALDVLQARSLLIELRPEPDGDWYFCSECGSKVPRT